MAPRLNLNNLWVQERNPDILLLSLESPTNVPLQVRQRGPYGEKHQDPIRPPSPHPYAPNAQPISFFSILSPAQYWDVWQHCQYWMCTLHANTDPYGKLGRTAVTSSTLRMKAHVSFTYLSIRKASSYSRYVTTCCFDSFTDSNQSILPLNSNKFTICVLQQRCYETLSFQTVIGEPCFVRQPFFIDFLRRKLRLQTAA